MALATLDLYSDASPSYGTGAKDTGLGVGFKHVPTPLLSTYIQTANPPGGWAPWTGNLTAVPDVFAHGSKFFVCCNSELGVGRGVIAYDLNVSSDQVTMAYDQTVGLSTILTGANRWAGDHWHREKTAFYEDGLVYLAGHSNAGSGNTPVLGCWDCATDWPFTSGNAEWLSPLQQNIGSYIAGQVANALKPYVGNNYIWVSSSNVGQIHAINKSTGAIAGTWPVFPGYSSDPTKSFTILGETTSKPCGGSYWPGTERNISQYDVNDLNNWSKQTQLLIDSLDVSYYRGHPYKRANRRMLRRDTYLRSLQRYELDLLGLSSDQIAWWQCSLYYTDRFGFIVLDVPTKAYQERIVANTSHNRSFGNLTMGESRLKTFVKIDGYPWFISWSTADLDQENENPGGNLKDHYGLRACPIGPVTVTYTKTGIAGIPKKVNLSQIASAKNFAFTCHPSKHRFRFRINAGIWTDWRSGNKQLQNLDSIVDGLAAWGNFETTDTIEIEHQMCSGWPYDWGGIVRGNPGIGSDPSTPQIASADIGPPRDIEALFVYEPTEFGGGLG